MQIKKGKPLSHNAFLKTPACIYCPVYSMSSFRKDGVLAWESVVMGTIEMENRSAAEHDLKWFVRRKL